MNLYVAGMERPELLPILADVGRPLHVLSSFYQLFTRNNAERIFKGLEGHESMVDSGAHSFLMGRIRRSPAKNVMDYAEAYIAFVRTWAHRIPFFVEMDVEHYVGEKQVDAWAVRLADALGGDRRRLVRVWHPAQSEARWQALLAEWPYVGIGGGWNTRARVPKSTVLAKIHACYERGTWVHGFGCTSRWLEILPFSSSDSLTWVLGEIYGVAISTSRCGRLQQERGPRARDIADSRNARNVWGKLDVHIFGPRAERCLQNLVTFADFEIHVNRLWSSRGIEWKPLPAPVSS